jgi:predicted nucleic acid-binding protein
MRDELEKLAGQQAAVLDAITSVRDKLDAAEWRRKCLWILASINRSAANLKECFPNLEKRFANLLEPLDRYANLVFETPQDLRSVYVCYALIAEILEKVEKARESESFSLLEPREKQAKILEVDEKSPLWQVMREIQPLIEELGTLQSGDSPSVSLAGSLVRSYQPELRDAERAAVRERLDQRLLTQTGST